MKAVHTVLEPFFSEESKLTFTGGHVFSLDGKNLILGKNGFSIIISDGLLDGLRSQKASEDLWLKLIQHRLAFVNDEQKRLCTACTEKVIHPAFFMIDLTNRCNMACKYCLRDGDNTMTAKITSREMTEKICRYIADYCKKHGEDKIMVQPWGGEPLLEKEKIFLIQDILKESGIDPCISIETNGLLLTDELIDELYRRNIWVSVSIDGPEPLHDSQRVSVNGKPTHAAVERNLMKLIKKYDGNVSVIATVTKQTGESLEEIIDYLTLKLGLSNIKLNFVHKSGFVDNEDMCLTCTEISRYTKVIFEKMVRLAEQGHSTADYNIWTKMHNLLTNPKSDVCICDGCHGGYRMITFDCMGNIYPCDVTDYPEECLGNIDDSKDLVELIRDAVPAKAYFKEKRSTACGTCPWRCYCMGGCTVHVKTAGMEPPATDAIECAVNKALYPEMVDLILTKPGIANGIMDADIL